MHKSASKQLANFGKVQQPKYVQCKWLIFDVTLKDSFL